MLRAVYNLLWPLRRWLPGRLRLLRLHGVLVDLSDPAICGDASAALRTGSYELEEVTALRALARPEDRIAEVGAGLGVLTTVAAKLAREVTAFEANPVMRRSLERTFALNDVRPSLRMLAVTRNGGSARVAATDVFWTAHAAPEGREVASVTFHDAIADATLVVLDCEGEEAALLADPLPPTVLGLIVEIHEAALGAQVCSELIAAVLAQGFRLHLDLSGGSVWAFSRHR